MTTALIKMVTFKIAQLLLDYHVGSFKSETCIQLFVATAFNEGLIVGTMEIQLTIKDAHLIV